MLSYPVMYKKEIEEIVNEFVSFKSNMGLKLSIKKAQYIWGKSITKRISDTTLMELEKGTKVGNSKIIKEKIDIVKKNLNILLVFNWVRFVGISGSVAAGFAKEDDDIDIFIVVKDGCAWIYRGILTIRNIFNHVIRTKRDKEDVRDLLCINFIIEESGLELESDIFNFHELMYLIPIYNERYINHIYEKNLWLLTKYQINKELLQSRERKKEGVNFVIKVINFLAYISQIAFMLISGHTPEIKRLFRNYKRGRIEFFPSDYKEKVLRKLISV
ncbi:hypothetical protein CVU76_00540 [Candidatus Dojkabacteria bacterium HGW-Dojkabacteria-1]|uniref:Polymerase nucleotidyl transferase domain-containing protein n=1 Tax=Candidatus Dojkabacteria bacterium HGW-Dojkabacteria-1 TaxID=2013761 RepID=A0A2N2F2Y0_9BACT|nr:MAG: hypothetical protein CVU76_00540 [Candidatus Dojkabacteria bacterium HGW-Dojkabacteria-1]